MDKNIEKLELDKEEAIILGTVVEFKQVVCQANNKNILL